MKTIKAALKPARRRLAAQRFVKALSIAGIAALGAVLVVRVISFIWPFERMGMWAALAAAGAFALVCLVMMCMRPKDAAVARKVDAAGLHERASTMLEFEASDIPLAQPQREDAIEKLKEFDYKKAFPLRFERWTGIAAAALCAVIVGSFFITNPQDAVLRQRHAVKEALAKQAEKVDKSAAEAERADDPELAEALKKLAEALRESATAQEGLKEVSKTREEVETLLKRRADEAVDKAADSLAKSDMEALAEAMKSRDAEAMEKALEELKAQSEDAKKAEELAEALEEAAEAAGEGALSDALAQAADAIKNGNSGQWADASGKVANATINPSQSGEAGDSALAALSSARASIAGSQSTGTQSGKGTQPGGGEGQGQPSQGKGGGKGGGAGTGSGEHGDGEVTPETSGAGGYVPGRDVSDKPYDEVFDPKRMGGDSEASSVGGQDSGEGRGEQGQTGPGLGTAGGYVPYNEIIKEYEREAGVAMERESVPSGLRGIVEKYFSMLNN